MLVFLYISSDQLRIRLYLEGKDVSIIIIIIIMTVEICNNAVCHKRAEEYKDQTYW